MDKENLVNTDQFKRLKKGDCLLVNWNEKAEVWDKSMKGSMLYKILKIQKADTRSDYPDEIILRVKGNIFFNFRLFVKEESNIIKSVYLCRDFEEVRLA